MLDRREGAWWRAPCWQIQKQVESLRTKRARTGGWRGSEKAVSGNFSKEEELSSVNYAEIKYNRG